VALGWTAAGVFPSLPAWTGDAERACAGLVDDAPARPTALTVRIFSDQVKIR
jgi:hypothetical protein